MAGCGSHGAGEPACRPTGHERTGATRSGDIALPDAFAHWRPGPLPV